MWPARHDFRKIGVSLNAAEYVFRVVVVRTLPSWSVTVVVPVMGRDTVWEVCDQAAVMVSEGVWNRYTNGFSLITSILRASLSREMRWAGFGNYAPGSSCGREFSL